MLAAIAAKGVKELTYHRDYAARWVVTLARGTDESRRRPSPALRRVALPAEELSDPPGRAAVAAAGVGVDPADVAAEVDAVLDQVLDAAGLERPDRPRWPACAGRTGRDGLHTEALAPLLAEMQVVARAHPTGRW